MTTRIGKLFLIGFLLAFAGGIGFYTGKTKRLVEQPKKDLFERKQECQKYQDVIEKRLADRNFYNEQENIYISHSLSKIFYSPKQSSCVFAWNRVITKDNKFQSIDFLLEDALTGDSIVSLIKTDGPLDDGRSVRFQEILKEYES